MPWYGLNGQQISPEEAAELLGDMDARTIDLHQVEIRPGTIVTVRTMFVVHAEGAGIMGEAQTPLWETHATVVERRVFPHPSRQQAETGHNQIVNRFRADAIRNGMPAGDTTPAPDGAPKAVP